MGSAARRTAAGELPRRKGGKAEEKWAEKREEKWWMRHASSIGRLFSSP